MNVISKTNLFLAARKSKDTRLIENAARWYELATRNNFDNFVELQAVFPAADWVSDRVIFNLGSHRLICGVSFRRKILFFKAPLSHAEYGKGGWKS